MPYNYYAVLVGREGTQIYDNSAKFFRATYGLSGASGRGFDTIEEAQQWLNMHFRRMAAMQMRTDTNINVTVNITNNIMQPPGAGAQTSSTAATAMTTSVTHGSSTFPRQPVHHTHMGSHMPPQHVQQPPSQVPPPVPPEQEVTLSEEQESILDLVRRRKNVFFTGAAGAAFDLFYRRSILDTIL
ncbi:hypothetical protein F5J12DRAFT_123054 [Pisolithus orientalis]|uniref:uncharacterized protein n=1 Tax=Pisolithus orientalis TaxID=936130 RepID=UPI002224790E|nr:uncharacterized protein F5J12DRAFT_123054 [Pisolithus orientalis]KAI6005057.1 hypothetical protein F5J12DRAFT_123054 [Pisolithus orientalis]